MKVHPISSKGETRHIKVFMNEHKVEDLINESSYGTHGGCGKISK